MPKQRPYLRDCRPGDTVQDAFIVSGKQLSATAAGKPFIKLFVSDASAQLTARIWNASRELFAALPDTGVVRVSGRIENYQNNLQIIIDQFWPAEPDSFDWADLLPHTTRDIPQMRDRLTVILRSVRNADLRSLLEAYLADDALMSDFCKAPAASAFHHAFIGGLLEHTLSAIEVADVVCPLYPQLNRDLVVAGIFLHDIAKTWELTYEGAFAYSDGGNLVGHIVKSAIWVEDKSRAAAQQIGHPLPRPLIDVLQHIILAHHGTQEFGSPKTPATPEAIAVHMIENLDAKLMISLSATRDASGEGNWSEYIKSLGARLYRPDVAPPDEAPQPQPSPARAAASATPPARQTAPPSPNAAKPQQPPTPTGPSAVKLTNPLFDIVPARKP